MTATLAPETHLEQGQAGDVDHLCIVVLGLIPACTRTRSSPAHGGLAQH